jgi:hypothetical protein
MVFLGVWALFGIGTLAGNRNGASFGRVAYIGRVLNSKTIPAPTAMISTPTALTPIAPILGSTPLTVVLNDSDVSLNNPTQDRVLGRIFAWFCTTLYLTSRLPQIWKNVSIIRPPIPFV